jgi:hypothetical protein
MTSINDSQNELSKTRRVVMLGDPDDFIDYAPYGTDDSFIPLTMEVDSALGEDKGIFVEGKWTKDNTPDVFIVEQTDVPVINASTCYYWRIVGESEDTSDKKQASSGE